MNCAIQSLACLKSTFEPMVEQSSITSETQGIPFYLL